MISWTDTASARLFNHRCTQLADAHRDGIITARERDRLRNLYRAAASARHPLPPIHLAIEDLRELGCFARPIPQHKIDAAPVCQRPHRLDPEADRTGTTAGYDAHLRAGDPPCPACRAAATAARTARSALLAA